MRALRRSEELLAHHDPGTALKAAHAIAALAGAVVKLVEVVDLEDRLQVLEARVKELAGDRMATRRKTA